MLQIKNEAGRVRVSVPDRFDIEEVTQCRSELYALMSEGIKQVIFDFSHCQFVDSTGLGFLVSVYKRCAEGNIEIALCGLTQNVLSLVKMTRLDQVFTIYSHCSDIPLGR